MMSEKAHFTPAKVQKLHAQLDRVIAAAEKMNAAETKWHAWEDPRGEDGWPEDPKEKKLRFSYYDAEERAVTAGQRLLNAIGVL